MFSQFLIHPLYGIILNLSCSIPKITLQKASELGNLSKTQPKQFPQPILPKESYWEATRACLGSLPMCEASLCQALEGVLPDEQWFFICPLFLLLQYHLRLL